MRTTRVSLAFLLLPFAAEAQSLPTETALASTDVEYRLGGAAEVSALAHSSFDPASTSTQDRSFQYPFRPPSTLLRDGKTDTALGQLSVFGSEVREEGREALRLGTALTRGRTTAGVSLIYRDEEMAARSELFLDYALTESFSVGLSGIVSRDDDAPSAPAARLGVNAAYSLDSGTFLQGGIADAPDTSPVVGVSVGLRF